MTFGEPVPLLERRQTIVLNKKTRSFMLEHVLGGQQPHCGEVAMKDLSAVTAGQTQDLIKEQAMPKRTRF